MKLKISEKYMYVLDNKGQQFQYFEHFEDRKDKSVVIKLCTLDKEGDKFLSDNSYGMFLDCEIYWFGKKIKYSPMFIKEKNKTSAFHYLVLFPR